MSLSQSLDDLHARARRNRWLGLFTLFNRVALAAGFLPSGMVKVLGERFTDLAANHPMGHYLNAFFQTGYYYTFVGVLQVTAAVLLLIPRTALLGAIIYLPIILNILVLSLSVRFQGSLLTAPLMLLANLYLLCWDYHRFRLIFPWNRAEADAALPVAEARSWRFPFRFVGGVILAVGIVFASVLFAMQTALMPMNRIGDCRARCAAGPDEAACLEFCACVHTRGEALGGCVDTYYELLEG
ncbi:DoxX family protein [Lewinella sp. IMCC34183]|uniref:DoxX family protein n=1 Tax=Lewinella sp. IMCC34183 TaxID=2248762 RepID=UPI000E21FB4D|nr:DoxX family protein [Lewinella sp. IMCC34183]